MSGDGDSDPQMLQLGGYIRLQRQMADLSLRRLADMTKVSNAYLSQIERGLHQPSIRVLRSIAEALNLSADTLLSQAGMEGATPRDPAQPRSASEAPLPTTEAAIRADPALSAAEQEALIQVYRSFIRGHSPD
ncbi:MAG TPA: helix-turn-helix transcriptional regulator [Kineosporiaceae bacterium]|nr:helix-turn-helix transcriptional regulator [Kineosporiaceae bacterium]